LTLISQWGSVVDIAICIPEKHVADDDFNVINHSCCSFVWVNKSHWVALWLNLINNIMNLRNLSSDFCKFVQIAEYFDVFKALTVV